MTDVAELAKKSSVAWVRVGDRDHPVWHEWVETEIDGATEGAICLVGGVENGGIEQPLPPLDDGDRAIVLLRSKTDRQLAATVPVMASVVEPASDLWESVTAALKAGRLNAPDTSTMIERWARECRVLRLVPDETTRPTVTTEIARTTPRLS